MVSFLTILCFKTYENRRANEVTTGWKHHKEQNSLPSATNTEPQSTPYLGGRGKEKEQA